MITSNKCHSWKEVLLTRERARLLQASILKKPLVVDGNVILNISSGRFVYEVKLGCQTTEVNDVFDGFNH